MRFGDLEELVTAGKQDLGSTDWQVVSAVHVSAFAELTGDHQWVHTDEERAKSEGPFGSTIVHGALLLALIPVFVAKLLIVEASSLVINVGMDRARFRQPVPVGGSVRGAASVISASAVDDAVLVEAAVVVELFGTPRPACQARQKMLFRA